MDFTQIRTLDAYYANQDAVDARLARKSTRAEYEADKDTIQMLCALKDCDFIFESLKMTEWHAFEWGGVWAYCTPEFWQWWRVDRIQINNIGQVNKRNGRYILYTYSPTLAAVLIHGGEGV